MTKLSQKAGAATELLAITEANEEQVARREALIRRFLWAELELSHEGISWSEHGATLLNEEGQQDNLHQHLGRSMMTTGRVLPGVGMMYGYLLQSFANRGRQRRGKSTTMAAATAGFMEEKQLAVVQHGSLLLFKGRPTRFLGAAQRRRQRERHVLSSSPLL